MDFRSKFDGKRIVLAAHIVDGYPSEFEYLRDFLISHGVSQVTTISSPLESRSEARTTLRSYRDGKLERNVSFWRPNIPPLSFALDFLLSLPRIECDLWIGFNPIMSSVGVWSRANNVANWAIDFVPSRGSNRLAERSYRAIERFAVRNLQFQIENTTAAMNARTAETGHTPPVQILAPIGVWEESFAAPSVDRHKNRSVVYFGSLDERNGVQFLVEMMHEMLSIDPTLVFHVIGDGPLATQISHLKYKFSHQVKFHGYVQSQRKIDTILRTAVVALAPYSEKPGQFTQFADPQKLKYYAANGLPVILTDVAPAARKMSELGGATVLRHSDGALEWAQTAFALLNDADLWLNAASRAYTYGQQFDRKKIYWETLSIIASHLD